MPKAPPFQKGNPGGPGRPKGNTFISKFIMEQTGDLREVVEKVLGVLRKTKKEETVIRAAEWLRDTAIGKPKQMVNVGLDDGLKLDLAQIIAEARDKANG